MPKLDIGAYYWYINETDYQALVNACNTSGGAYSIADFGFALKVSENPYDSSYVGYYAVLTDIDDDEMMFIAELGLESFDNRQIKLSVQASVL